MTDIGIIFVVLKGRWSLCPRYVMTAPSSRKLSANSNTAIHVHLCRIVRDNPPQHHRPGHENGCFVETQYDAVFGSIPRSWPPQCPSWCFTYFSPSFSAQCLVPASDELEDAVDNKGSCNSAVSMCSMPPPTLTEGQHTDVKAQSTRESQLDGKGRLDLAGANLLGGELWGLDWARIRS